MAQIHPRSGVFLNMYPHRQMSWAYGSSALHPPAGQSAEMGMSCEGAVSARRLLTRAAECQLAAFHHGDLFFYCEDTRRVEKIPSGLQGQGSLTKQDVQQQRWWHKGCSCCGGEPPCDQSYRRGREERKRRKCLNWQILPAALRVRDAVVPEPQHGSRQRSHT
ncbi:uncharacterized protein RG961_001746 [Leptosomus discolor]